MKCPECGCIDELQVTVDLEQWTDTEPDNTPDAEFGVSAFTVCGHCNFQGSAERFGLTHHVRLTFVDGR